jgi:hypothetical protein
MQTAQKFILKIEENEIYEGKLNENKRNGYGILFSLEGKKLYEGEWFDDMKQGKGIEYF